MSNASQRFAGEDVPELDLARSVDLNWLGAGQGDATVGADATTPTSRRCAGSPGIAIGLFFTREAGTRRRRRR